MNLQQLRYFRETLRRDLNLTAAAAALHTSQPGLSKAIRDLEAELGVTLFVRAGKRLTGLTDEGEHVAKIVQRLLTEAENLKRAATDWRQGEQSELRIAATHTQARYTLPKAILAVRSQFPNVVFAIQQGTPTQIAEWIKSDQVDLGLASEALQSDQALETLPLFQWQHVAIVPLEHSLAHERAKQGSSRQPSVALAKLAEFDLISYDREFAGRTRLDAAFKAAGLTPRFVLQATDSDVIKTYVRLGLGVGIVAEVAMQTPENGPESTLQVLRIEHLDQIHRSYVGHLKARTLNRVEQALVEALQQVLPLTARHPM
jgi:DNA-binding transcriptional LysR family regulator